MNTVKRWGPKLKKPDGKDLNAVLRGGRGRPTGAKDTSSTKRWERCQGYKENQAEFVACCAWLLKVIKFTYFAYADFESVFIKIHVNRIVCFRSILHFDHALFSLKRSSAFAQKIVCFGSKDRLLWFKRLSALARKIVCFGSKDRHLK